ncbi:MAG: 7-carboxy-7-deazaguanine synthase QueE [Candidatus Melainabacteria bacterium]
MQNTEQFTNKQKQAEKKANITEIFSSVQGEGPLIGFRHIFLRFMGCDLRCNWCDTPNSLITKSDKKAQIEQKAGARNFAEFDNPMSIEEIANAIIKLEANTPHQSLSLTGGEPLLQKDFIKDLIPSLKAQNFQPIIYLETGGHRYKELSEIINLLDFVSFDLKLPSSTHEKPLWDLHAKFVEILSQSPQVYAYAKAVLTDETQEKDLIQACELLLKNPILELVLQPVSLVFNKSESKEKITGLIDYKIPTPEKMLRFQEIAVEIVGRKRIRIIPQTHKLMGQI